MSLMVAGSGLTERKLLMSTALPSDVISGKTFYSGDKSLKTGTLIERGGSVAAQSYVLYNSNVFLRFPQGAYRTNGGGTGVSETYYPLTSIIQNIGLIHEVGAAVHASGTPVGTYSHAALFKVGQQVYFGQGDYWGDYIRVVCYSDHVEIYATKAGPYLLAYNGPNDNGFHVTYTNGYQLLSSEGDRAFVMAAALF